MRRATRVMLTLVANITQYPRQISRSKDYNSVAGLPFEQLAIRNLIVDVMSARAFQPAYPFADEQRWRHAHDEMHVVVRAADSMKDAAFRLQHAMLNVLLHAGLDVVGQYGRN